MEQTDEFTVSTEALSSIGVSSAVSLVSGTMLLGEPSGSTFHVIGWAAIATALAGTLLVAILWSRSVVCRREGDEVVVRKILGRTVRFELEEVLEVQPRYMWVEVQTRDRSKPVVIWTDFLSAERTEDLLDMFDARGGGG